MSCAAPKSPLLNSVTGTWMVGRVRGLRAAPTSRPFRVCQLGGVVSRLGAAESVDHNPVGTGAATAVAAAAAFCLISTPSAALAEPMFSGGSVFSQHQQQHLKAAATTGLRLDRKADRPPAWASSQVGQAAVHFMTGGVGGCIGAAAVFPIDLVKTRLQAQKTSGDGNSKKYSGGIQCFSMVVKDEGPLALYSGLSAQLIGVWPEKAVKLTANDFVRSLLMNPATSTIPLPGQILAGAFGGMCQTVFTNPLEIVKIQLQLDGVRSTTSTPQLLPWALASGDTSIEEVPTSASRLFKLVSSLGLAGLYRGAATCAARDMLFSGIYFPLFAFIKEAFLIQGHQGGLWLLLSGTLAGAPAAYLATPLDMLKTRQQADSTDPTIQPVGFRQCLDEVLAEGGWQALFTGAGARVARSAPQFGVTLFVYDQLNGWVQDIIS